VYNVKANGEQFETNDVLRADRKLFYLNPRVFANNSPAKLHHFVKIFTLVTLQGSVRTRVR